MSNNNNEGTMTDATTKDYLPAIEAAHDEARRDGLRAAGVVDRMLLATPYRNNEAGAVARQLTRVLCGTPEQLRGHRARDVACRALADSQGRLDLCCASIKAQLGGQ